MIKQIEKIQSFHKLADFVVMVNELTNRTCLCCTYLSSRNTDFTLNKIQNKLRVKLGPCSYLCNLFRQVKYEASCSEMPVRDTVHSFRLSADIWGSQRNIRTHLKWPPHLRKVRIRGANWEGLKGIGGMQAGPQGLTQIK